MKKIQSLSTGGVLIKDNKVLLVQVNYGNNKDLWMIPGGFVDAGESLEEAVVREIREETGFSTTPLGIIGLRCGVKEMNDTLETTIHVIYQMNYISGSMKALDEKEISNIEFVPVEVALAKSNVIELSKAFIRAACDSNSALLKQSKSINTNTEYRSYDVYTK